MSWNGSGTFNRLFSWVADKTAGLDISSSRTDSDSNDIASNGFGNCLTRDGQGQPTANLPMANFRHTGVGSGVARTDYAAMSQVEDGLLNWTVGGGTSDAITATYTPALASLSDGQLCCFRATAANLTTTPTFAPNGLTARTITKNGGSALAVGDIRGNLCEVMLRYNSANTRWELLNPPDVPVGGVVPFFGGTVPSGFALPTGQNLVAATFPAANAVLGTTYGSPGGGNFTMPDLRGRVFAHLDSGGSGRITVAGGNFDGTTLGTAGGGQNHTLTTAELAVHSHANTLADNNHTHSELGSSSNAFTGGAAGAAVAFVTGGGSTNFGTTGTPSTAPMSITNVNAGSGNAHTIVQPTMVINCMMRIA